MGPEIVQVLFPFSPKWLRYAEPTLVFRPLICWIGIVRTALADIKTACQTAQ